MNYVLFIIYWLGLAATWAYAYRSGGPPERIGASLIASASTLALLISLISTSQYGGMNDGLFLIDVALLVALAALALRADRFWPMAVAGLQFVGVGTHVARRISPQVIPEVYAWITGIWGYPMVLIVAIGTLRHRQRVRAHGIDRSWSISSRR